MSVATAAAAAGANKGRAEDPSVHITQESQKKINIFAIRNGWLEELNDELAQKQTTLKNLEDAESDISLLDEGESVPIFIGETFVHFNQQKGLAQIESLIKAKKEEIGGVSAKIAGVKREMDGLRKELYAQFGDSINLECEPAAAAAEN